MALSALLVGLLMAQQPERIQVWQTLGCSTGACQGMDLVEAERTGYGTLVRRVHAVSAGCHGSVIRVWEKGLSGVSPEQLVRPLRMCQVTQADLDRHASRHHLQVAFEADSTELTIRCGNVNRILEIPRDFEDLRDTSPDYRFFDQFWELPNKLIKAGWGAYPHDAGLNVEDREADEAGQRFVSMARERADVYGKLGSALKGYRGPQGSLEGDWSLEAPAGVKVVRFKPQGVDFAYAASRTSGQIVLIVDRATGRVVNHERREQGEGARVVAGYYAEFDPATVPADGRVPVTVAFKPVCAGN